MIHPCLHIQWNGIGSVMSWWKAVVNTVSPFSLNTHLRCVLMRKPLFSKAVLAPPGSLTPPSHTELQSSPFISHPHAQVEGYCDEITMTFSLSRELQSPGMKEAGLMGEMITCHGYKNGWREGSLRGREIGFFCGTTLRWISLFFFS